jgi:hypothetical protein
MTIPHPHQHRSILFEVAKFEGPHTVVTVRSGPKAMDRALLGRLTMDVADWQALRSMLVRGQPSASLGQWHGPTLEIHYDDPEGDR